MRLPRIYQHRKLKIFEHYLLDGSASHYLIAVLRVRCHDHIRIFNGEGDEFDAVIKKIERKCVVVETIAKIENDSESPIILHLAQGVARGEKMDFIIQKSVELGVNIISPIFTERTTIRLDLDRREKRLQHWHSVMISAVEQCGRTRLPQLNAPVDFSDWLKNLKADRAYILSPHVQNKLVKESLPKDAIIVLLIGPEGGLSDDEIAAALNDGFQFLNLGPRTLRTETATISALSIMQYVYGDI